METAEDVIVMVDEIITDNPDTALDLLSDMVEDLYENQSIDRPDTDLIEISIILFFGDLMGLSLNLF